MDFYSNFRYRNQRNEVPNLAKVTDIKQVVTKR